MPNSPRIVLGLGTGRCGTRSLAAWLNGQQGAHVSHEANGPAIAWENAEGAVCETIRSFPVAAYPSLVGDVATYYLPYVAHVAAVDPRVRFICLKRDREETVVSFAKKTPHKNHWMEHDGAQWKHSPWDHCFPKYLASSKAEAIGLYWDDYYRRAAELEARYPRIFRVVPTESLNTVEGQRDLLDFLTVPEADRRFAVGIRLNVAKPQGVRRLIHRVRKLLPRGFVSRTEQLLPAEPDGRRRLAAT